MGKGTLYLVPNTLGDEDRASQIHHVIPPQIVQVAAQLDTWIVENAKTTRSFLSAVNQITPLRVPLQEIHMLVWKGPQSGSHPKEYIAPLLEGKDVGLMSEAGLPAIADPGSEIVALAHAFGIPVKPLTGPSSLMLALMASGMNGQSFAFHGYLPIKNPDRSKKLKTLESDSRNQQSAHLWIETPYRNLSMLTSIVETLSPNTQVCLAMDLTLPSELILRHSVKDWAQRLGEPNNLPKNLDKRPAVFVMQSYLVKSKTL
jgi:16S rRNA (cytidine1402-2'-O)-methyltransferase